MRLSYDYDEHVAELMSRIHLGLVTPGELQEIHQGTMEVLVDAVDHPSQVDNLARQLEAVRMERDALQDANAELTTSLRRNTDYLIINF